MKFLLSSLQLASLCALSSWSVSSQMVVSQSEDVTIKEGDTAQITCCWKSVHDRVRVTWIKNQTEIKHDLLNTTSESNVQSNCLPLTITKITKEHSGTYFCKVLVEIPQLEHQTGNGTVITVISKKETEEHKDNEPGGTSTLFYILIGVAVAALILLITFTYFCCLRRKRDQAARVIYEVPHFDSETQDMDKHSTGSRGSSQWCQVPVYESFDYFEHVEAKKSG